MSTIIHDIYKSISSFSIAIEQDVLTYDNELPYMLLIVSVINKILLYMLYMLMTIIESY